MPLQLSTKEKSLLNDQKSHEEICIQKYQKYASQASDPQLKQLFTTLAQQEQQHLATVNSILSGQVPAMNQSQQQASAQSSMQTQTMQANANQSNANQADAMLCSDMLMTEKYVSGAYDTAIFEFADSNVRQALNHIQKEEQKHGEDIFNYMNSKGMYNV